MQAECVACWDIRKWISHIHWVVHLLSMVITIIILTLCWHCNLFTADQDQLDNATWWKYFANKMNRNMGKRGSRDTGQRTYSVETGGQRNTHPHPMESSVVCLSSLRKRISVFQDSLHVREICVKWDWTTSRIWRLLELHLFGKMSVVVSVGYSF